MRHGESEYNVKGLWNDDPSVDVHLTELGKNQANKVIDKFKDIKLDLAFSSELPRVIETAKIITKHQNLDIKKESRLNERMVNHDGKSVLDYFNAIDKDPLNTKLNGGENFYDTKNRIVSFIDEIVKLDKSHILVVAYGETLQIIKGYFEKLPDEELYGLKFDNCQVLEFDV